MFPDVSDHNDVAPPVKVAPLHTKLTFVPSPTK